MIIKVEKVTKSETTIEIVVEYELEYGNERKTYTFDLNSFGKNDLENTIKADSQKFKSYQKAIKDVNSMVHKEFTEKDFA